jgi:hypothetical protein
MQILLVMCYLKFLFFFVWQFSKGVTVKKDKCINTWKVNRKCHAEVDKPKAGNEKWRWSHERCVAILNGTSSTKHPFSPCLDTLSKERRKTLYKQCMEESCRFVRWWIKIAVCVHFFLLCSCAIDAHDCPSICSWFASLSELCRKERHPIKSWRNEEFCRKLTTHWRNLSFYFFI